MAVTAHADVTRVHKSRTAHLAEGQGSVSMVKSEKNEATTTNRASAGGEPGFRSNAEADISAPTASGTSSNQTDDATEFVTAVGSETTETDDPRGMPTFVAATIQVPQSYVVGLITRAREAAAAQTQGGQDSQDAAPVPAPTDEEVAERFDVIRKGIEDAVRPHLKALGPDGKMVDGEVSVSMYADAGGSAPGGVGFGPGGAGGALGTIATGGGLHAYLGDSPVQTALVGVHAVVASVLMLTLIRRSGRQLELPVAEELVGLPQALPGDEDLIGEADASEGALVGLEIGDDAMRGRQLLEQVSSMVQSDPESASRLIGRWIAYEE